VQKLLGIRGGVASLGKKFRFVAARLSDMSSVLAVCDYQAKPLAFFVSQNPLKDLASE
jgi:hypothetical protein